MSDQDIFTDTKKPDDQSVNIDKVIDVWADKLLAITNDDGKPKYENIDKALDALKASQDHIKRLEAENATDKQKMTELTEAANRAAELEETIRTMTTNQNNSNSAEKPQVDNNDKGGLSEEKAAELIKKLLNENKQVDAAVQNVKEVNDKLTTKFGDKAPEIIDAKAKELGVTKQQLKELSATSPAMVLALFGGSTNSPLPTTSSVNTASMKTVVSPDLKRPEKSVLSGTGATDANRAELMRKIKEGVYKRLNVET